MLALRKISIKKLTIYVSIIILMLGGTGFMLYQNQRLTNRQSLVIDDSTRYDKLITTKAAAPGGQAAPPEPRAGSLGAEAKSNQPLEAGQIKNNKGIDLTIFSNGKFKELKENILIPQENSGLGKRDPFKPN